LDYGRDFLLRVGRVFFVLVPFAHMDRPILLLHPVLSRNVLADATVVRENHCLEEIIEHGRFADWCARRTRGACPQLVQKVEHVMAANSSKRVFLQLVKIHI
jgi:hypothetical protein